jgi:hypothetical protein
VEHIHKLIRELQADVERTNRAIGCLEQLRKPLPMTAVPLAKNGRGRKSMPLEERRQVSERMRAYWAKRRSNTT